MQMPVALNISIPPCVVNNNYEHSFFSQCLTICGLWPHFCLQFSWLDEVDLVSPRMGHPEGNITIQNITNVHTRLYILLNGETRGPNDTQTPIGQHHSSKYNECIYIVLSLSYLHIYIIYIYIYIMHILRCICQST